MHMNRRKFLKSGITFSGSILCSAPLFSLCHNTAENEYPRVIIARNDGIQDANKAVDSNKFINLLDDGIQSLFDVNNPMDGWAKIVQPGEVIGLKVNCLSGRGVTHPDLVDAVSERLKNM